MVYGKLRNSIASGVKARCVNSKRRNLADRGSFGELPVDVSAAETILFGEGAGRYEISLRQSTFRIDAKSMPSC